MLTLDEALISMCRSSRVISFCFSSKTQRQIFCYITAVMFVPLRRAQTWRLHTKLYKFGWYTSANNTQMKNSKGLILTLFIDWLRFLLLITWLVKIENWLLSAINNNQTDNFFTLSAIDINLIDIDCYRLKSIISLSIDYARLTA